MTPTRRIYLAGPWADRLLVKHIASCFEAAGITVTHPWWDLEGDEENPLYKTECAVWDVLGVANAQVVVVVNTRLSEGKAVEQGLAIAFGIPIVVIGTRSHIFHSLHTYLVETVEEAITLVQQPLTPPFGPRRLCVGFLQKG